MFWEMHDALFDWQTRYANTAFSQNRLLAGADRLGLHSGSFTSCFNSAGISETLDEALNEQVGTTPTLNVNGVTILGAAGGIPTEAEILQAIDDATPDDWGMPAEVEAEAEAVDEPTEESTPTEEPTATDAPTDEPEATDEPEPTDAPMDEEPTPTAEILEEPPTAPAPDSETESDA